jgi:hypothetical protein
MPVPELSAAATLDLWQAAERRDPIERALVLAAAADGASTTRDVAALAIGRRDAFVLELHAAMGGGPFESTARCPGCGEEAEFVVDPDALLAPAGVPAPYPLEAGGYLLEWRSPDSRDLAAAAEAGDAAAAERVLLERCVTAATGPHGDADPIGLPPDVRGALAQALADADPLAEVLVDVSCPSCGTAFVADVDLCGFVWAGLRAKARALLGEVDELARAYGWTEADVLSLDDRRRAAYLELAREGRS